MSRFKSVFFLWLSIAILIFLCIVALDALGSTEEIEMAYQPYNFPQTLSSYYSFSSYPMASLNNGNAYGLINALLDPFTGGYIWADLSGESMPWDPLYYEFLPYNPMLWNPELLNFPALGLGLWYSGFTSQFQGGYFGAGSAFNPLYTSVGSSGIYPSLLTSEPSLVGETNRDGVNICWFIMDQFSNLPFHLQLAYAFPAVEIPGTTIIGKDGTCWKMFMPVNPGPPFIAEAPPNQITSGN